MYVIYYAVGIASRAIGPGNALLGAVLGVNVVVSNGSGTAWMTISETHYTIRSLF